ncbi:MAG: hypothetical protein QNK37_16180 [Acidobacteriota bacterium]|nr:hypothetical protein [Acidobacteriota bacterium]
MAWSEPHSVSHGSLEAANKAAIDLPVVIARRREIEQRFLTLGNDPFENHEAIYRLSVDVPQISGLLHLETLDYISRDSLLKELAFGHDDKRVLARLVWWLRQFRIYDAFLNAYPSMNEDPNLSDTELAWALIYGFTRQPMDTWFEKMGDHAGPERLGELFCSHRDWPGKLQGLSPGEMLEKTVTMWHRLVPEFLIPYLCMDSSRELVLRIGFGEPEIISWQISEVGFLFLARLGLYRRRDVFFTFSVGSLSSFPVESLTSTKKIYLIYAGQERPRGVGTFFQSAEIEWQHERDVVMKKNRSLIVKPEKNRNFHMRFQYRTSNYSRVLHQFRFSDDKQEWISPALLAEENPYRGIRLAFYGDTAGLVEAFCLTFERHRYLNWFPRQINTVLVDSTEWPGKQFLRAGRKGSALLILHADTNDRSIEERALSIGEDFPALHILLVFNGRTSRVPELKVFKPALCSYSKRESDPPVAIRPDLFQIAFRSPVLPRLMYKIELFSQDGRPILIYGEKGAGKYELACSIAGRMSHDGFFDFINCGEPMTLATGRWLLPFKAKVFYDIHKFSLIDQEDILEILNEMYEDAPFLFTSDTDLTNAVDDGVLLKELYDIISPQKIKVPPLREHLEDIPCLIRHFVRLRKDDTYQSKAGALNLSGEAMQTLYDYPWPGNVGELEQLVYHLLDSGKKSREITSDFILKILQKEAEKPKLSPWSASFPGGLTWRQFQEAARQSYFAQILRETGGDRVLAAKLAGVEPEWLEQQIERGRQRRYR